MSCRCCGCTATISTTAPSSRPGSGGNSPQKNAGERPVGILGFGEIGQDAGRKLAALGFPVSGWSRQEKTVAGFATFAGPAGLPQLLAQTEILVCLLPLTEETQGILNARTFAALPRGAGVVNAGRGAHLVEEDLIPALDSGQLSAAALDVFRDEPLPPGHSFWQHPRILVTPHIAGITNPRPPPRSSSTTSAASKKAARSFTGSIPREGIERRFLLTWW